MITNSFTGQMIRLVEAIARQVPPPPKSDAKPRIKRPTKFAMLRSQVFARLEENAGKPESSSRIGVAVQSDRMTVLRALNLLEKEGLAARVGVNVNTKWVRVAKKEN